MWIGEWESEWMWLVDWVSVRLTDLVIQDCVSESVTISHSVILVDKSVSESETISRPINQFKQSINQWLSELISLSQWP